MGNLVSNALRHTPEGGQIILSAQHRAGGVLLMVQDNGAGIAPEVLPCIFDRFYRGDESRQQQDGESGLGLAPKTPAVFFILRETARAGFWVFPKNCFLAAIVKSLVEAHGGQVSATSAGAGHGSAFSICLPLA